MLWDICKLKTPRQKKCCNFFYLLRFPRKNDVYCKYVLHGVHVLLMLFVFNYVYWSRTRFSYQMMSINSNLTGVTSGTGTASVAHDFIDDF
jgi:hypothetical protein